MVLIQLFFYILTIYLNSINTYTEPNEYLYEPNNLSKNEPILVYKLSELTNLNLDQYKNITRFELTSETDNIDPFIENYFETDKFKIISINPNKKDENNPNCSRYGYATCINLITDKENNIIFTDLNKEKSIGMFIVQNEIGAYFQYGLGEGGPCGGGGQTTVNIFEWGTQNILKKEESNSSSCPIENCECKNQSDYVNTSSAQYYLNDQVIKNVTEATLNKFQKI